MTTTIYRAQTIGSLLRPDYLKDAKRRYRHDELSAAELKRIEDQAVDEALALQENAGFELVSDGEQRRLSFLGSLVETTEGLSRDRSITKPWHTDQNHVEELSLGLAATGKLRRLRSMVGEEFVYARARAHKPIKVTLPSPMMLFMFWSATEARGVYRDPFELFADGAEIIREEIRELARLGCEYIQIDAPELAIMVDPSAQRNVFELNGISPTRVLGEGLDLLNGLADVPGISFGLHMCRGNNDGRWLSQGGYEAISQEVFKRANHYGVFLLEYDDWRSGSFAPLADVPHDKQVVLGLVSTKKSALEPVGQLVARIDGAARYFPREQMGLSPQCGFASGIKGNPLDAAAQKRKLELVVEVAHRVWP
ncbi:MAG: cobalamin-independent methionine synthase II family protein [Candidatus Binataceae bacterium]